MNNQEVPTGFIMKELPGRIQVVKSDLQNTLAGLMDKEFERLGAMPGAQTTSGRAGPVHIPVVGLSQRIFIRPYAHGGIFAGIRGGLLFPGPERAMRELAVSAQAQTLGLPIPEIIGITARRTDGNRWRLESWSWWIPDSMTLSLCLKRVDLSGAATNELMGAIAQALKTCHDKGLRHADLNSRNVLVMRTGGGWRVLLVDLDGARFEANLSHGSRVAQLKRLYRSLVKEGVFNENLPESTFTVLLRAYFAGNDKLAARTFAACRSGIFWHKLFWKRNPD